MLARASPFLSSLLTGAGAGEDTPHLILTGLTFSQAMALLNLVYVGRSDADQYFVL